jgi:hypothetical protein
MRRSLSYNARYYDPRIGRFVFADSIVPCVRLVTLLPHDVVAMAVWGTPCGGTGTCSCSQ